MLSGRTRKRGAGPLSQKRTGVDRRKNEPFTRRASGPRKKRAERSKRKKPAAEPTRRLASDPKRRRNGAKTKTRGVRWPNEPARRQPRRWRRWLPQARSPLLPTRKRRRLAAAR